MFPHRVTHQPLLHPSKTVVWIFHKLCLCFLFMSRLNTQRPIPFTEHCPAYLSDIRSSGARQEEVGRNECSPSLQGPDINQTNYGATTVSNPWRGNEMIGGRSQLNTERVNENINYLMIYWESGVPPFPPPPPYLHLPHISLALRAPTTESICFNWVIIRLLHLAESFDLNG